MNTFQKHPASFIIDNFGDKELEFARYTYIPRSHESPREVFSVTNLTKEKVAELLDSLTKNQELALQSRIMQNGELHHIPMIDFSTKEFDKRRLKRLKRFISREIWDTMALYQTGRSFHAYSSTTISHEEYPKFLGHILLTGYQNGEKIIDNRWVGRRVIDGYMALRWSANSARHTHTPIFLGRVQELLEKDVHISVENK